MSRSGCFSSSPISPRNQGIAYTLDPTRFTSSSARAQAFEAGAIDLASGGATGVLFAAAEGVPTKIIASVSRESSRGFTTRFYAKESSSIHTVADLKGKIVGINGFSTTAHLVLKVALEKNGLAETDVSIVPIPFAAMEASLEAGKIDCGIFPQPFASILENDLKVRQIFDTKYSAPFDEELDIITGKDEFLKANSGAVKGFLLDLKSATEFLIDHTREARQMLLDAKLVRVPPEIYLNMSDWYRDPTLRPDVSALEQMQAAQVKAGFQTKTIDIKSIVDTSYLPN